MAMSIQSLVQLVAAKLRSPRLRVLAPLLALALVRYSYHRQRRHLVQQQLHRQIHRVLESGHDEDHALHHRAVEEWHDVGDGVQFGSIVYQPKPESERSNVLVLFVPGNPGTPFFYLALMRDIVRRFGTHHEVRGISHIGHYMPWKSTDDKVFDLVHQYEHKIAYLRQRFKQNPDLKLVLVSHSIGSYLALKIIEAFPDRVVKTVFMQPAFHNIGKSPNGELSKPLLIHKHHTVKLISLVEFLLPLSVRRWAIQLAIGTHQEAALVDGAMALVNHRVMRNVLHMGLQEMTDVGDVDEALMRVHEQKALFVYSPVDGWVPNEFAQMFQVKFPRAAHRMIPQSHGFMIDKHGSRDMADHIAMWIEDVMHADTATQLSAPAAA